MDEIKIVGVLRVKNEERWIGPCLREASKVCNHILVVDDGSTDRTPEICKSFSKVKYRFYQRQMDEVRDRSELLQWALECQPDWILILDGDEVLEEGADITIRNELSRLDPRDPVYTFFYLHILYFWNDPEFYRCENSIYGNFWIPRLFTTWGQDTGKLYIGETGHGHNLHSSGIPANLAGKGRKIDVRVKHYGYLDSAIREKKYNFYMQHDPEAASGGYYDHLTSEKGMSLAMWVNRDREQISSGIFLKPFSYYRFSRPEVSNLVPSDAIRILDIGCGQGNLGALLKSQNPRREVVGIELDRMAASAALNKLDVVMVGNIEKMRLDFPTGYFDCIILSDVLEHLHNPWDTLLYLKKYINPGGCLVLSIPNVRNFSVINCLVNNGYWPYREAGIMDRGHLRFFTVGDIQEMLYSLNMTVNSVQGVRDHEAPDITSTVETNKMTLKNLSPVDINELQTVQFLIRAKPCIPLAKPEGLTSIVIPVCNQVELLRLCLESIERHTGVDHEIIVVDNGSVEETVEYLSGLKNIRLIRHARNLGFAAACNSGLAAARGKYICLLNSDTIVTADWLVHLIYHLEQNKSTLAVGAVSNHAPDGQLVPVELSSINAIDAFARHVRLQHWLKSSQSVFLSGFCLLLKEKAKKVVGGFDTRFWPGNFEDDDYCLRIKLAGYELLIAHDVYIHHFGAQTFSGENFDYEDTMRNNWRRFREKWRLPEDFDPIKRRTLAGLLKGKYKSSELYLSLTGQ